MNSLGQRVRFERERQRLSQRKLAFDAGLDKTTICDLEKGTETNPGLATVLKIAVALGVSVADLFLEGPDQLDAAFGLAPGVDLGPLATLEERVFAAVAQRLPEDARGRVSVWPWCEPPSDRGTAVTSRGSAISLRAPASLASHVALLGGVDLPIGAGVRLDHPVIRPVTPRETLRVLVKAPGPGAAADSVRRETTAAGCCPPVTVVGKRPLGSGFGWLAEVVHVPAKASQVLQRLRVPGPEGLFVPA